MKKPRRDLPLAVIGGILIVAAVYITVNLAIVHTLPLEQVATAGTKAINIVSTKLFGTFFGVTLLTIGIMVSIFGCLNGHVLAADPRIPYAMALEGDFPPTLTRLSPYKTSTNGFVLQTTLATLYNSYGIAVTMLGIPVYYFMSRRKTNPGAPRKDAGGVNIVFKQW
ncbi:APC family permease [Desulfurispora thermophila]|uniref:APC family permease n=1 Tax=Desulfurispora thermophila TaxID=265470 RepID=UPI00035FA08F|nr:amino acid permease [Desulfurispora thermophila]